SLDPTEPFTDFHPSLELTDANFLIDQAGGSFLFVWAFAELTNPCAASSSLTIPDEEDLFTVHFVGITGNTEVFIFDSPLEPYITRFSACPVNIGCFCTQTATITVEGEPSSVFGGRSMNAAPITLFPNPASQSFQLQWPDQVPNAERLQILDVHGKVFWDDVFRLDHLWSTEGMPAGLYFIRLLWNDGQSWTKSLLVE
ncbi:MAG: T9SS type A sorting domain-containing protein, partial [Bacteroidota bacterium]